MKHRLSILILLAFTICLAGDNPAVGKWDCTSVDRTGVALTWTLVVSEENGNLSASLIGDDGTAIPTIAPKLDGHAFTFRIQVNDEETVEITTQLEGRKLDGTFKGKQSGTGTFKGTKQA